MNIERARDALDGLMFGDGTLRRFPKTALYHMGQCKPTVSLEDHLKWEYWLKDNVFSALGIKATARLRRGISKGKEYRFADMWTQASSLLAIVHDEWYTGGEWAKPRNSSPHVQGAVKRIPERLMSVSEMPISTLVQWFLGDGGSGWIGITNTCPAVHVQFSTHCFTKEEVYHLMDMLSGIGIVTTKPKQCKSAKGSGLVIRLAQESINYFMDLVAPTIIEMFGDSVGLSYKDLLKYRVSSSYKYYPRTNYPSEVKTC